MFFVGEWMLLHCCILQNLGLHVRWIGVCGYGYGWKISYPRQDWGSLGVTARASCLRHWPKINDCVKTTFY